MYKTNVVWHMSLILIIHLLLLSISVFHIISSPITNGLYHGTLKFYHTINLNNEGNLVLPLMYRNKVISSRQGLWGGSSALPKANICFNWTANARANSHWSRMWLKIEPNWSCVVWIYKCGNLLWLETYPCPFLGLQARHPF